MSADQPAQQATPPTGGMTSLVVVDNHESTLESIAALVRRHPDELRLLGTHLDTDDLDLTAPPPDVVVLDLYLGRDDTDSTPEIPRLTAWGARVLLHTSAEFPVPVRRAVAAGAHGLSLKNDGLQALLEAIRVVAAGGFACSSTVARALLTDPHLGAELTPRELEVVQGIDDGLTHQQVARRCGIAESTVKEYLKAVRSKYLALGRDISNAHSIVREARRDGWLRDN